MCFIYLKLFKVCNLGQPNSLITTLQHNWSLKNLIVWLKINKEEVSFPVMPEGHALLKIMLFCDAVALACIDSFDQNNHYTSGDHDHYIFLIQSSSLCILWNPHHVLLNHQNQSHMDPETENNSVLLLKAFFSLFSSSVFICLPACPPAQLLTLLPT